MTGVSVGEIYYAYNDMERKNKYHICVTEQWYVFVNTEDKYDFNILLTEEEGKILDYDSYICLKDTFNIKSPKVLRKAQLDTLILEKIIEKTSVNFEFSDFKKDSIKKSLEIAIERNKAECKQAELSQNSMP